MNTVPPIIQNMIDKLDSSHADAAERDNVATTLEEIARQSERAARIYRSAQAKLHKRQREDGRQARSKTRLARVATNAGKF